MNDIGGMLEEQTIDACAEELINDFDLLGDWEERYGYIIDLGKTLPKGSDSLRHEANKVQGCVSQVWLESRVVKSHHQDGLRLRFEGDSDASIVRGLIAIILRLYSDRTVGEILSFDACDLFMRLGLEQHLIPQRSNGLHSMLRRIRADAAATSDKQRIDPGK